MSYDPKSFWEDRADSWKNENFATEADWEQIKDFVRQDLPTLEIGCGTGRWASYFKNDYVGIDISQKLVEYAIEKYGNTKNQFFYRQDIRGTHPTFMDVPGQIFTYTALEHIPTEDIGKLEFPENYRLVFVEPHGPSGVEHCFQHDYEKIFGAKPVKVMEQLTIYMREP